MLLVFIMFICVKFYDNFSIVVWLWRLFHKCLVRFRRQWNIRSYLVNALATFIVLSYVKILNVSFQFLISSLLYDINGHLVSKSYWYYDGRVDMTSGEYLPYLVFALSMLFSFNIFPWYCSPSTLSSFFNIVSTAYVAWSTGYPFNSIFILLWLTSNQNFHNVLKESELSFYGWRERPGTNWEKISILKTLSQLLWTYKSWKRWLQYLH